MTRLEALIAELEAECGTTRRHLVRLDPSHFEWRPHAKSFSAGELCSHMVDCVRWAPPVFRGDALELDPGSYEPFSAAAPEDLMAAFDDAVSDARSAMYGCKDDAADQAWELRMGGKVWFRKGREEVFRDMTLSHLIHHRGQLTVYFRLLGVAVPMTYGPTADEKG